MSKIRVLKFLTGAVISAGIFAGMAFSFSVFADDSENTERVWLYGSIGKGGDNKNNRVLLYDNPSAKVLPDDASNTIGGNSRATGAAFGNYISKNGQFPKKVYLEPDSGTKYTEGHNGYAYFFTEIDPKNENWILQGDLKVVDRALTPQIIDNQSAFGIIATDIAPKEDAYPYQNSVAVGLGRHRYLRDGAYTTMQGGPGLIVKTGFTDPTGMTAPDGLDSYGFDTECFDHDFNRSYRDLVFNNEEGAASDYPVRWKVGDTYKLMLKKDNTGFRASILGAVIDGKEIVYNYPTLTCYEPDVLLVQEKQKYFVGFFASRKVGIEVYNISFETSKPNPEEKREERPKRQVRKSISFDSAIYSGSENYTAGFYSNVAGKIEVQDLNGQVITSGNIIPNKRVSMPLKLKEGKNSFKAVVFPAARDKQTALASENFDFPDYEPFSINFSVNMREIAPAGQVVYVSIKGNPDAKGTRDDPVTLKAALDYAQPGQQIVAMRGRYFFKTSITIQRGNDGGTLIAEPGAVFDLSNSKNGGLIIRGSDWHVYNLEICNSKVVGKPIHVQGHRNRIEKVFVYNVADSGINMSGVSTDSFDMWPSNNLFISCHARNSVDQMRNNADGYAMKLTVGNGNKLKYCIASFNVDDGYDFFAQASNGPIGVIEVDSCIAYGNGHPTFDYDENGGNFATATQGNGQGFKLGGAHMPGAHIIKNSISFLNYNNGITSNSGSGVKVYNNTIFRNFHGINLYSNYAIKPGEETKLMFEAKNNLLIESGGVNIDKDKNGGEVNNIIGNISMISVPNGFYIPEPGKYKDSDKKFIDFFNPDYKFAEPKFRADGTIDMNGFLLPTDDTPESKNTDDKIPVGADFRNLKPDGKGNPLDS